MSTRQLSESAVCNGRHIEVIPAVGVADERDPFAVRGGNWFGVQVSEAPELGVDISMENGSPFRSAHRRRRPRACAGRRASAGARCGSHRATAATRHRPADSPNSRTGPPAAATTPSLTWFAISTRVKTTLLPCIRRVLVDAFRSRGDEGDLRAVRATRPDRTRLERPGSAGAHSFAQCSHEEIAVPHECHAARDPAMSAMSPIGLPLHTGCAVPPSRGTRIIDTVADEHEAICRRLPIRDCRSAPR